MDETVKFASRIFAVSQSTWRPEEGRRKAWTKEDDQKKLVERKLSKKDTGEGGSKMDSTVNSGEVIYSYLYVDIYIYIYAQV